MFLITHKFKLSLENQTGESKHSKTNKKVNLLHNALIICNWIQNFDTSSINDCFDSSRNRLPVGLT